MKPRHAIVAWLPLLALCAGSPARASSPPPEARTSTLAGTTGSPRVCEGGSTPGAACSDSTPCATGTCTGFVNVRVAARGLLTIIADTKTPGQGWTSTSLPGCTNPNPDPNAPSRGSCESSNNALFTLLLEFTLNGKKYTYASTFAHLPAGALCTDDPNNNFDCLPTIDSWNGEAGWNEPAVESTISEKSLGGNHLVLRWGGLPSAAESAVAAVIGKTASQRIVVGRIDEVPICTDPTPCGSSVFSDHSAGADPLATVRRFKVDIAVVGP
ncbi:MAG TPA: hypothetical protein VMR86_15370 [Myxococcota bacterium]|nr:hypothetical protein [Myxococcota bacterium]